MATRTKIIGKKISEMDVAQDLSSNTLNNYSVPLANEAGGNPDNYTNEKAPLDKIREVVKDDDKVKVQSSSNAKYLSEAINNPNLDYDLGDDDITLRYPDIRIKSKTIKVNGEIPEDLENHYKDVSKSVDDPQNPSKNIYDLGLEIVSEAATWLNYNDNDLNQNVSQLSLNTESTLFYSRQEGGYGGDVDENCGLPNGVYMVYADIGFWFEDVTDELNEVTIKPYVGSGSVLGKEVKFFVDHTQEAGYVNHKECVFLVKVTDSSEDARKKINLKAVIDGARARAKIFHIQIVAIEQSYISYIEAESSQYDLEYIHYAHEGKAISFSSSNNTGVVTYIGAENPNFDASNDISGIDGDGILSIRSNKKYCGLCTLKIESLNPSINTYRFEARIKSTADKTIVIPFTVDASEASESSITFDWVALGTSSTSITIAVTESIATGDEIVFTPTDFSVFEFGVGLRNGTDGGIESINRDDTLRGDGVGTALGIDTVSEENRVKDFMRPLLDEKQDALNPGDNIQIDQETNTISATDTTYTAGAGTGLSIDAAQGNKISINKGNGIGVDSNNDVYVKKGIGLDFDGGALVIKQGTGITVDTNGVSVAVGKGLNVNQTTNKTEARLGNGLEFSSQEDTAAIKVKGSNGIEVDESGVKAKGNSAKGIEVTNNGIALKNDKGITFDENGNAIVDKGDGLDFNGNTLVVKKGKGLDFDSGALVVKGKANGGIKVTGSGVELQVKSGGNVKIDSNGDVDVPTEANGGIVSGANGLKLATPGNGISQDAQSGALSAKANTAAGIDVDSSGIKVKADATKGVNVDETSGIQVKLAQTDAGLEFDENGGLKCTAQGKVYQAGDGIDITGENSDIINVKLATEGGLQFDENGGLKIKPEEIETVVSEEVETAVETLQSRILYTFPPAAATEVMNISSNWKNGTYGCYGVLFSPSMDIELIADTTSIVFFIGDGNFGSGMNAFYAAIYEYSFTSNSMTWICNTSDFKSTLNRGGLKCPKITNIKAPEEGETSRSLHSNKLYYIVLVREGSVGDAKMACVISNNSAHSVPRRAFHIPSMTISGLTDSNFESKIPLISSLNNEDTMQMFAAVTNVSIGTNSDHTLQMINPIEAYGVSSYGVVGPNRRSGTFMMEYTPSENKTVYSITLFDNKANDYYFTDPSQYPSDKALFKGNYFHLASDGSLVGSPNGTMTTTEVEKNGISLYAHTWFFATPIELSANTTYLIPVAASVPYDSADDYDDGEGTANPIMSPMYSDASAPTVAMWFCGDVTDNPLGSKYQMPQNTYPVENVNGFYLEINGKEVLGD